MTIVLRPPSQGESRSDLADWLELHVLQATRQKISSASLSNVLDFLEDDKISTTPDDDSDRSSGDRILDDEDRDATVAAAFEELQYRQEHLGAAYPFTVDARRLVLSRASTTSGVDVGRTVYLFCLFASAIREARIQPKALMAGLEKEIADNFQICACLAAGGYLNGDVVSFGFPRATGTGFLPALRAAYGRFGVGDVCSEIPVGLPQSLKDGGIDVVAWRDHPDRMPSKLYLLGQSASGKDWKGKSVVEYIEQFHGAWFTNAPAKNCLPAMFIPFTLHAELHEEAGLPFSDLIRRRFWYEEMRFGLIFDRLRIAHYADSISNDAGELPKRVEGSDQFHKVQSWVTEATRLVSPAEVAA